MAKSTVGPWAKDKLERLQKYLSAYTTIMRKQKLCKGYFYIDAFAGPGEHELCVRAHDETGRSQPVEPPWNVGGYANNAVQRVAVTVA
jgi:hypothetical protein